MQEVLQQEKVPKENLAVIEAPVHHVDNVMQNTQQQLTTQLDQIQVMMKVIKMQYAAGPQNAHQYYGGRG